MKKTKALVKFDFDVAVITALDTWYAEIQTAEGTKNLALVMKGLSEYREIRTAIDDQHKKLKKDILEAGRGLDGDKNRLKALIQPGESRLRDLKNTEDDRKDAIREEKATKERERIAVIQDKINTIRTLEVVYGKTASEIQDRLTLTTGIEISEDIYQEFMDQAIECRKAVVATLDASLSERLQFEKEEVERKAEAERLEIIRGEQAAEQKRIDEENKIIKDQFAKLEADRKAEEDRKEKEAFQKAAQEEADKFAKQKLEQAEYDRVAKEKADATEKVRQEALRSDKEKLIKFAGELRGILNPDVSSKKAQKILADAVRTVTELATDIVAKANKL